jgi:hypothetical protein
MDIKLKELSPHHQDFYFKYSYIDPDQITQSQIKKILTDPTLKNLELVQPFNVTIR